MNKLLVICGPTGTGKTDLALRLAKKFNAELVSADSRQVYLGMDIGTGKEIEDKNTTVKKEKKRWLVNETPIYLYDLVKPDGKFSLADFQQLAVEKINEIQDRGKLPILVGGTGLYIRSIVEGLHIPKAPPDQELRAKLEEKQIDELLAQLQKIDPETFQKIDKNNKRRLIRAFEVYYQTGEPISQLQRKFKPDFEILEIGLSAQREELYRRNDIRVEKWFETGFVAEVKTLLKNYSVDLPSMTSLGYRQVAMFLNKQLSLEETKQRIKFEFHSYIRRQLTWFKKDRAIYWFDVDFEKFEAEVENLVADWLKSK